MKPHLHRRLVALLVFALAAARTFAAETPPNVIFIFTDDLGYGDLASYGAKNVRTPNIDRLAAEGTRFTSFYVAQAVCTASRAALMTGSYPNREHERRAQPHQPDRPARGRAAAVGTLQGAWIRNWRLRQVAPRPSTAVSAYTPWVR